MSQHTINIEGINLYGYHGLYQNIEANLNQGNLSVVATLLAAFTPTTNIENHY